MITAATCLWFHDRAEEAADYYVDVFDQAELASRFISPEGEGFTPGSVLVSEFVIAGHRISLLNGGTHFTQTPAASIEIRCEDQAESDRYYDRLIADGGEESWCGWLTDRYGVSWQIFPEALTRLLSDPDPARAARGMAAMRTMRRIDLAGIEAAMGEESVAG